MVPASAPAPAAATPAPAAPVEERSFVSGLIDEPLIPGAVLLLLLVLGYGGYRVAQNRRANAGVDSSFLESKPQPDSFFGASGGQRVDTAGNDSSTSSSMAYSPASLTQAETWIRVGPRPMSTWPMAAICRPKKSLKEAIRHNPDRISVHAKLAEIYAKRQDRKALEVVARDIYRISNGQGTDWNRVTELGRELDPDNRFYQPGGQAVEAPEFTPQQFCQYPIGASEGPLSLPADLDFDLDLDLPDDALTEAPPAPVFSCPPPPQRLGALPQQRRLQQPPPASRLKSPRGPLPLARRP